jgi:peptidoglycan/LPS O-acetylase OafA/YrhL
VLKVILVQRVADLHTLSFIVWRMKRIPEIDGLRALAALSVFAYHVFGFSAIVRFSHAGWVGVDLFFVISGYLITTILLGMRGDPHYFKNFYMRRTLRIFPPYYLFFLICLCGALLSANDHLSKPLWAAFALYGTSIAVVQPWYSGAVSHLPGPVRAIEVTWSLSIEEFFYLLWAPAVRFLKRQHLFALIFAIIVFAPMVRWYMHVPGSRAEYYFLPARMDTLAFGALLALWRGSGRPFQVPGWSVAVFSLASASLLVLLDDPQANGLFAVLGYTLIALTMTLLLAFVLRHEASPNLLCRALRSRLLVRIGTISYMFYLLHLFVIRMFRDWFPGVASSHWALNRILQLAGSLVTTLALAGLSWKYFETPILRLKSRFGSEHSTRQMSPASEPESEKPSFEAAALACQTAE